MKIRTLLRVALVTGLVSMFAAPGLADSRVRAERYDPPVTRMEASRIAQSRSGRAVRAEPPPAPARTKQAKLAPTPPSDAARQAGSASARTARTRH
jgi:nucleoid-associated protein YgaU